ncbi:opioid-binding cell adhesion molecule-like isoform X2 [Paramuricea clavata]|uniref:Opioid-binding cell adhesion molecule-like isoform X2 n=1 Tax=Paramuricea clavata TaxID=317549 RepID=A0A7D9HVP1_PARCT|nr:opioid-binding cell adhesion molecule-like isoform X2 [Paramuricea clavata]
MVCLWNKLVGVILILTKMTSLIQCFCDERVPYFPTYYPEVRNGFVVDVLHDGYKNHIWRKGSKQLTLEICNKSNELNCTRAHHMYSSPKRADLHFREITLEDSGKYILELFCHGGKRRVNSFEIIVQDKPLVLIDCNDMTVNEGDNLTCVCKTTPSSPAPTGRWLRAKQGNEGMISDILTLENISKYESGTYTCLSNSSGTNYVNKTSFYLTVIPKNSKIEIKYFKVFQEAGVNSRKLVLLCKAEGIPQLKYTISHNGTAVKYGNMYTVDTRKISSLGQYECLAKYGASSDKRLLFLDASLPLKPCLEKEKRNSETEWRIRLIIGASSFLTGIFVLYVLMCCCKKCKKKDDCENSKYDDVCPRKQETLSPASENHEMKSRYTLGRPVEVEEERQSAEYDEPEAGNSDDRVYYNESNYHEFNASRHWKVERYQ